MLEIIEDGTVTEEALAGDLGLKFQTLAMAHPDGLRGVVRELINHYWILRLEDGEIFFYMGKQDDFELWKRTRIQ